jgi:hypothetical protein
LRLGLSDARFQLAPRSFSLMDGLRFHAIGPGPFSSSSLFRSDLLFAQDPCPVVRGPGFRLGGCKLNLDYFQSFAQSVSLATLSVPARLSPLSPAAFGSKVGQTLV